LTLYEAEHLRLSKVKLGVVDVDNENGNGTFLLKRSWEAMVLVHDLWVGAPVLLIWEDSTEVWEFGVGWPREETALFRKHRGCLYGIRVSDFTSPILPL
jgi:hypothetical protein